MDGLLDDPSLLCRSSSGEVGLVDRLRGCSLTVSEGSGGLAGCATLPIELTGASVGCSMQEGMLSLSRMFSFSATCIQVMATWVRCLPEWLGCAQHTYN